MAEIWGKKILLGAKNSPAKLENEYQFAGSGRGRGWRCACAHTRVCTRARILPKMDVVAPFLMVWGLGEFKNPKNKSGGAQNANVNINKCTFFWWMGIANVGLFCDCKNRYSNIPFF